MISESRVLFCNSPYGQGGIGQHFAQLVEESRASGALYRYIAPAVRPEDPNGLVLPNRKYGLVRFTPLRFLPSWKSHAGNVLYDSRTARILPRAERLMGFVGKSIHSFRKARRLGYERLELVAANSHVDRVQRQHAEAARATGVADTWLNRAQLRQTRREYEMADVIYVHSEYVRTSFLEAGINADKLRRMCLTIDERFRPPPNRTEDGTFRLVYVGRLDATKGIPLLLDAFDALPVPRKALTLVGGWSSPALQRHLQPRIDADPRITVTSGDPVPALHRADVFVHPTFEDGFAYAPAEALACGVPVIVTEDTGMKEYVREGENGFVVPTGSVSALVDRLLACHDAPLTRSQSLLPEADHADVPVT